MTLLTGSREAGDTSPTPTEPPSAEDQSVGQLAAALSEQMSRLVRDELALAQVEAKQRVKRVGLGIGLFGASGFVAIFGIGCLVAAAVLGFATVLSGWLAALVVAALLFAVAGLVALLGRQDLTADHPQVPGDTIRSVKADVAAVKGALHR